jgi:hypothetical protein
MRTVIALLIGSLGTLAFAGTLDHLACFKVKDPLLIQESADLQAEMQPEFTSLGCILKKATEFCVPASKTNVTPPPPFPGVSGQPLQNDYICYPTKCRQPAAPPDKLVTDQFGSRIEKKYKISKVCVPARKAPAPCGPTGKHMCGGACPNPTQQCQPDPLDRGCVCLPAEPGCFVDPAGHCAGTCPGSGQACTFDDTGHCGCSCSILIPGGQTNVCAMGTCPSPKTCVKNTTDTACICCAVGGVACSVPSDCCPPFSCVNGFCS